jgi:hypothetical protein
MRIRVIVAAAWAGLAVAVSHVLGYALVYRDPVTRAHVLHDSGHGWTSMLLPMLVISALAAFGAAFLNRYPSTPRRASASLFALAAPAFILIEVFERAVHERSLTAALVNLSTSWIPVVVGLLVLAVLSPLLVRARRIVEAFAARRRAATPTSVVVYRPALSQIVCSHIDVTCSGRGPPSGRGAFTLSAR